MIKLFLVFQLISFTSFQQTKNEAAIVLYKLSLTESDTQKVNLYNDLCLIYSPVNSDSAMKYANKSLYLSKKVGFLKGEIKASSQIGSIYYFKGDYGQALQQFLYSNKFTEKFEKKFGSSDFTHKQLSNNFNNIGLIYLSQKKYEMAEDYFVKSLNIDLKYKNLSSVANCYNNIGTIKEEQNQNTEAIKYYQESLKIKFKLNDSLNIPSTLINIGIVKMNSDEFDDAYSYFTRALKYCEKTKNATDLCLSFINLGDLFYLKKEYEQAIPFYIKGIKVAEKQQFKNFLSYAYESVSETFLKLNNYKKAYEYHTYYAKTKDEIFTKDNSRLLNEMQVKFETSNKEKQIKLLEIDKQLQKVELKKNRIVIFFTLLGLVLLGLFTFYSIRLYRQKQKINIQLQENNNELVIAYDIVEEKQKEILDSIKYAKRIQSAILPPSKLVKEYFKNSFIIYKPKDIIAGDFYWMENKDDLVLFAAADCTGHGVPGAMVSVVCNNGLNRSVREYNLNDPGQILDKTREIVIQEFEKSDEEMKDGMDISLCVLNINTKKLLWAGANNPLWILREGKILEYKPNKQPIGRYITTHPFETHQIDLFENDCIYIFTDGFQDQFGGDRGKKYKISKLRNLILMMDQKSMAEQHQLISEEFNEWKGDFEQVDDVCVFGVKI